MVEGPHFLAVKDSCSFIHSVSGCLLRLRGSESRIDCGQFS